MLNFIPAIATSILLYLTIPPKLRNLSFFKYIALYGIICGFVSAIAVQPLPTILHGCVEEINKAIYALMLIKQLQKPEYDSTIGAIAGASFSVIEEITYAILMPNPYRVIFCCNHIGWTYLTVDGWRHDTKPIATLKTIIAIVLHTTFNLGTVPIKFTIIGIMIITTIYIIRNIHKQENAQTNLETTIA